MEQLLAHLVGDYILQSHTMATRKTKEYFWALLHAFTYTLPFMFLTHNFVNLFLIFFTHFLIDKFRLVRYVIIFKNCFLGGGDIKKERTYFTETGFPKETPAWLAVWLMIITDNTLHLLINYLILK